jgi:hypothetical protein
MCQKKMYMLGVRETKELRKKISVLFSAFFCYLCKQLMHTKSLQVDKA